MLLYVEAGREHTWRWLPVRAILSDLDTAAQWQVLNFNLRVDKPVSVPVYQTYLLRAVG